MNETLKQHKKQQTHTKRVWIKSLVTAALAVVVDEHKAKRLKHGECRYCFYVGSGLAGQGSTEYTCLGCGEKEHWLNTSTPTLCEPCAKKHKLCRQCGADINL